MYLTRNNYHLWIEKSFVYNDDKFLGTVLNLFIIQVTTVQQPLVCNAHFSKVTRIERD